MDGGGETSVQGRWEGALRDCGSECYLEEDWEGACKSMFTISYSAAPRSARKYWASPGGGWRLLGSSPPPISLHFLEGILFSILWCGVSCTTKGPPREAPLHWSLSHFVIQNDPMNGWHLYCLPLSMVGRGVFPLASALRRAAYSHA